MNGNVQKGGRDGRKGAELLIFLFKKKISGFYIIPMPTVTLKITEKDGESYKFEYDSPPAVTPLDNIVPLKHYKKAEKPLGTIVEIAVANQSFTTLVAAVTAAGLVDTLQGPGPFTVFAPTNAAFAALPPKVLAALLLPENKALLVKILTYHVVSGKVLAKDITPGDVATVEGSTVNLGTKCGVSVNKANVVIADVMASNGVIHAIDAVLLPEGVNLSSL
jgi:uncharacterized surface protein with fasciclin (FAS1) repeats